MRMIFRAVCLAVSLATPLAAQTPLQDVLQAHQGAVANPSRGTVGQVLDALRATDLPGTAEFLRLWQEREVYEVPGSGLFYYARPEGGALMLVDIDTGTDGPQVGSREVNQIRPNAGVRREIGAALVRFELTADDPARRLAALEAIGRSPDAEQIPLLAESIEGEPDARIRQRKERVLDLLK